MVSGSPEMWKPAYLAIPLHGPGLEFCCQVARDPKHDPPVFSWIW
jgi:hypothetical protein